MSTKIIGFLENKLTLRGTTVALYDYADYNETLLNNKSIIITRLYDDVKESHDVNIKAYNKFEARFEVVYYKEHTELDAIIEKYNIDVLYCIKYGSKNDNLLTDKCKTLIHCVFKTDDPHGSQYCGISEWLNEYNNTNVPILHHMVTVYNTSCNLRNSLNIPDNAIVFGSYGGTDKLDDYFINAIIDISNNPKYSNIYFLFMNIPAFSSNTTNLQFFPGTDNMEQKREFINTCDAMVYGRTCGETFGLACGEFSICDKPVIANRNPKDKFHINTLGENIILHTNYNELYDILTNFNNYNRDVSINKYKLYTPENVMNEFNTLLKLM